MIEFCYPLISIEKISRQYVDGCSFGDIIEEHCLNMNVCKQILEIEGIIRRNNKTCKGTIQYHNKYRKTIMEKYHVENVSQIKEVKEKKILTMMKNHGYSNQYCNPDIQKQATSVKTVFMWDDAWRTKYMATLRSQGVSNVVYLPGVLDKIGETNAKRLSKMSKEERRKLTFRMRQVRFSHGCISTIESIMEMCLYDLGVQYKRNVFVGRYNVDFILNDIILEVQGDLYHAHPLKYKAEDVIPIVNKTALEVWEKDAKKKETLSSMGYNMYYIWERDIYSGLFLEQVKNILQLDKEGSYAVV